MDYTLAIYHQEQMDALSARLTVERLVGRGYPEYLLDARLDPRFPMRGLLIDKRQGHILKMNRHKVVQKGYHGFRPLSEDVIDALYHHRRIRPHTSRYRWVDTLFELCEVAIYAGAIDAFEARGESFDPLRLFDDIRTAVDDAHRDGTVYRAVTAEFERFVERDPGLARTLHKLRSAGKHTFLLTNSPPAYTQAMMSYLLAGAKNDYPSWQHYFDVVITSAQKPLWFREGRPFLRREGEALTDVHSALERGHVYEGGNRSEFERLTGASGHTILYVGDHIYGDILRSKKETSWGTAMIIPELGQEIAAYESSRSESERQRELEDESSRLDDECRFYQGEWKTHGRNAEPGDERRAGIRHELDRIRGQFREILEEQRGLAGAIDSRFHPYWGSLLKDRNELSSFGLQVEQYADLYTRRVSCFEPYSPNQHFRSPYDLMPHEL